MQTTYTYTIIEQSLGLLVPQRYRKSIKAHKFPFVVLFSNNSDTIFKRRPHAEKKHV